MGRIGKACAIAVGALVLTVGAQPAARAERGRGGSEDQGGASREGHGSMSHGGSGHEGPEVHRSGGHAAAGPRGVLIRETKLDGIALSYRLYSWDERNAMMKGMEGHVMAGMDDSGRSTHHLMVFVTGADGKELSGGKVGFVVAGPDKAEFKTLTMAMSGGYGADVPLQARGVHTVRIKAVFGDRTLGEEFTYTVK